jgi:glycerophosphoryl diester phosphodiesterase
MKPGGCGRNISTWDRRDLDPGGIVVTFNLQGHRGARGLRPENTLPSFEAALDAGASSVELDLHLSRDRHLMVCHDPVVSDGGALVSRLTRAELQAHPVDRNPEPGRFPNQQAVITPVVARFAKSRGLHPFVMPTLAELFDFVAFYAQDESKPPVQRAQAGRLVFDLELKRVPARPEAIGDNFDGRNPGVLEELVLAAIRRHALLERTVVRSFDHRGVWVLKQMEPRLRTAVLMRGAAPVAPEEIARRAGADIYCPEIHCVDQEQVRRLQAAGLAVLPWTVNEPADWQRLLDWQVDGITTDYPDRLAEFLRSKGVEF